MQIHLLIGALLFMVVNTQEILGSGSDQEISGDYSSDITTAVAIMNNNTTVVNIITIIPDNNTIFPTTLITLFPTTNASQPCLTIWQKIQILLNFATFDVNQYLNCLANNGRNTQQNSLFILGFSIIAILMNN
jgi:hypothetical protein